MRIVATIEARMTSSRLSGKVLLPVLGRPLLAVLIERLRRVHALDQIVVATTINAADDSIAALATRLGVGCFRGSEEDVLGRVLGAARAHGADLIVEITGDCPLIDPEIIQRCIDAYLANDVDFVSNTLTPTYPWGMDTKVFATAVLAEVDRLTTHPDDREHVSLYIYEHPERYRLLNVAAPPELTWPEMHAELDTREDYELIKACVEALYPRDPTFGLGQIIAFLRSNPSVAGLVEGVARKGAHAAEA